MVVENIRGLSNKQILEEVQNGAKFIVFPYCYSFIFFTKTKKSNAFLVLKNEKHFKKGTKFFLITLFLGWWGIPFGPFITIKNCAVFFKGGENVTSEITKRITDKINKFN